MIEMAFRTFSEMLIYTDTQNMLADKNVIKLPSDMKEIRKKKGSQLSIYSATSPRGILRKCEEIS